VDTKAIAKELRSVNMRKHIHYFFRPKERALELREGERERERKKERESFLGSIQNGLVCSQGRRERWEEWI
jgi:hypothetical protein